mgnify:CR=1 FL=1
MEDASVDLIEARLCNGGEIRRYDSDMVVALNGQNE